MEGLGYGWTYFNHRLGALTAGVDEQGAFGAVVGGTSTTGETPLLPEHCDPDQCEEFPFLDEADLWVRRVTATAPVRSATGAATWLTGAAGSTARIALDLPGARNPVALLRALRLDTAAPLLDCYDPAFGWHPRRIRVAVGAPVQEGDRVSVDVEALFEAGPSEEAVRACVDAVHEDAVVTVEIGLLIVDAQAEFEDVHSEAQWSDEGAPFDPVAQLDPAPEPVALSAAAFRGWTVLDWQFHPDETRGAYLRTLGVDLEADGALGTATNFSPGTQLSGFHYTFDGTVGALDLDVDVVSKRWEAHLPAALDAEGQPVVHRLAPAGPAG